jgi:hypothetical protein
MEAVWLEECRGSFAAMIADKQRREAAEAQSQAARAVAQPDELIDFVHLKARRPARARAPGRTRGRSAQRGARLRRGVRRAPCAAARIQGSGWSGLGGAMEQHRNARTHAGTLTITL